MSTTATSLAAEASPGERLEVLFDEIAELTGQRNAIDARLVEIVAEMERDELCGSTGARSLSALVPRVHRGTRPMVVVPNVLTTAHTAAG